MYRYAQILAYCARVGELIGFTVIGKGQRIAVDPGRRKPICAAQILGHAEYRRRVQTTTNLNGDRFVRARQSPDAVKQQLPVMLNVFFILGVRQRRP